MSKCKICNSAVEVAFEAEVLGRYPAQYLKCSACGFLFIDQPCWLEEAYSDSITHADIGLLSRNLDFSRKLSVLLYHYFDKDASYLDYAGGYGVFTRLMRDIGFKFYHTDPYTENLFAREYDWQSEQEVSGVTSFECFEHLVDPMADIGKMLSFARNLFFSTVLLPSPIPAKDWHYYAFEHGQHVSFYSTETLKQIADQFGLYFMSVGNLHFFSEVELPVERVQRLLRNANRVSNPLKLKSSFDRVQRCMNRG